MIHSHRSFFSSVSNALRGILVAIQTQRNMIFHLMATTSVLILAYFSAFSTIEWLFLWSAIFVVITSELFNSALENTIDLITKDPHPLAKNAKDISAGAVLISALYSLIVGYLLFYPRLGNLLSGG